MRTEPKICQCPLDWVRCFSRSCVRGKKLDEQYQASVRRTLAFLGDPAKPTSFPWETKDDDRS